MLKDEPRGSVRRSKKIQEPSSVGHGSEGEGVTEQRARGRAVTRMLHNSQQITPIKQENVRLFLLLHVTIQ